MPACDDFRRSTTRRQFVGASLAGGLAVYASRALPMPRLLEAAQEAHAAAPDAPILVSVFLPGGLDLLDTLPPAARYGRYADLRKAVRLAEPPGLPGLPLGLHPKLREGPLGGIAGLYARGQVGFLPGIDYANPDLSHFHSRHFWETGLITAKASSGWLGRWLDATGSGENPLQGISMKGSLSPLLRTAKAPVAAIESPNGSRVWTNGVWGAAEDRMLQAWAELATGPAPNAAMAASARSIRLMHDVMGRMKPYTYEHDEADPLAGTVPYPDDNALGERLSNLAGMLSLPLGIRVAAVEAEGDFDTHDDQRAELDPALGDVSAALSAFQLDLEARGLAHRVITFVWSEFGRRPEANGNGTDHGAGGVAWVQGPRVRGGVLSDYPSLTKFDAHGNLAVTIDFRRVYASLLEQWLGTDAEAVLPGSRAFGRVPLIDQRS